MNYNLCDEPWILLMGKDGQTKTAGLQDTFLNLHEYLSFAREIRLQDTAMLRLFSAISVTMIYHLNLNGMEDFTTDKNRLIDRFRKIWEHGKFPEGMIRNYFGKWRDRFYLIGGEHPFYQVPEAAVQTEIKNKGKKSEEVLYKLPDCDGNLKVMNKKPISSLNGTILDSNNKIAAYADTAAEGKKYMTLAESARWLLWYMAYADCGTKSPGKWASQMTFPSSGALVFPTGINLFETVMLNSVLLKEGDRPYDCVRPVWEREPSVIVQDDPYADAAPQNLPELYTQQSRRIILRCKDDKVTDAYVIAGDRYAVPNAFIEPMFLWKKDPSDKGGSTFVTVKYDVVSSWNNLRNVLLSSGTSRSVRWMRQLEDEGILEDRNIPFLMTGITYGSMQSAIDKMVSDEVIVNAQFFADDLKKDDMEKAIGIINELAREFYKFGNNLEIAEGADRDFAKVRGREVEQSFLEEAEVCFRRFLKNELDKKRIYKELWNVCREVSENEMEKADLNSYTNGEMTAAIAEKILWKGINIILKGKEKK